MANTLKKLASAQLAAASGLLYTVPALTTTLVKEMWVCNTGAGVNAVTIRVAGDTVSKNIWDAVPLSSKETIQVAMNTVIEAAGTIHGFATNANEVTVYFSGYESA